ncbi:MAG: thiol reductant ABC exporter subunit CydD [Candidatus Competibacterales bacterium]
MATTDAKAWLTHCARGVRGALGLAVGLGLANGLLLILQASLLAHAVHGLVMEGRGEALLPAALAVAVVLAMRALTAVGQEWAGFRAGAQVRALVRLEYLDHLADLGPTYTERQATGALASGLLEQVDALENYFARYLPQLALAAAIPLAILAFVAPLNWVVGLVLLATAPLIPLMMALVGMGANAASQRQFQVMGRMSAHFLDTLRGLTTLKLFDRSQRELATVAQVADEYRHRTLGVLRIAFLSSAVLEFFSAVSIAMVAVYLGFGLLGQFDFGHYGAGFTLETALFILLLAPDFYLPLRQLGTHYHARAEALAAAEGLGTVLATPKPPRPANPRPLAGKGAIALRLEDVVVAYDDGQRPALRGLSFEVGAGEHVALVGPSGAGKTTVLQLLLGFVTPSRGRVWINDIPLDELDLEAWRRHLAWLGQRPVLLHGTLADNIALGDPSATRAQLEAAAATAHLDFVRDLPHGFDTVLGEAGAGLSGGQAQRVALARMALRDAGLMLLDEPTASLDAASEAVVTAGLDALGAGRTVINATHRYRQLLTCDRILVLEDGRLVEQGSHRELMAAGGLYRQLAQGSLVAAPAAMDEVP